MRLHASGIAVLLAAVGGVSCGKTDPSAAGGPGPMRSDRPEPRISDLTLLSAQTDPPGLSFSLRVELGRGNVAPENCAWVVLGDPSVAEQVARLSENEPRDKRMLSASAPGWAAEACTMTAAGEVWTGQVKFKDMRVKDGPVPVSVFLLDDEGKLSNRLDHRVDFKAGRLTGSAAKAD